MRMLWLVSLSTLSSLPCELSVGWDPGKGLWRQEFLRAVAEMRLKLRFSESLSLGFYLFISWFIHQPDAACSPLEE